MKRMLLIIVCLLLQTMNVYANAPTINANIAILMDAKTGTILYEKNAYTQTYPASITKIMTALLVIENLSPTDIIKFSREAIFSIEYGSSHIAMDVGEELTVNQALHALLLNSANEVANGLAEAVGGSIENFGALMTARAHSLGATSTQFKNPHGLHDSEHYTTAYDMALITQAIYDNSYFLEIMDTPTYQIQSTNMTNETIYLSQQHSLMNPIRDSQRFRSDVIGGKTGYTSQAGNTLVTVARQGEVDLIVVILQGDISTYYADTIKLLDYGFSSFQSLNLSLADKTLTVAPLYSIQSGKLFEVATCTISTKEDVTAVVSADVFEKDLDIELNLEKNLTLGASIGDVVGDISYSYNGKKIASTELIISSIDFLPAPQAYSFPANESDSTILTSIIIATMGVIALATLGYVYGKFRKKQKFYRSLKYKYK
ncbi:MAG: hypothetical protein ATN34_02150 [Epulopiscium sp. Nele67-Bin002]|nr:MAG: hypothetical protein ATN34_02150 [Epulopiscium sp. Nele67-Bin002]OON92744.1 MAG: hypothetical protein ATN33_06790 [Epulopiscium sp. Nele67-Bin001]